MSGLNGRVNRLEKAAEANGEKRRLVLYHHEDGSYGCIGHHYTEDDLPRLREEYDLVVIHVVHDR